MGGCARPDHVFLLVQDFMIQAGDPTGTGRGGECTWGGKFEVGIQQVAKRSQMSGRIKMIGWLLTTAAVV